ncbi:MAG: immunoglobulin domain-containing protein [Opitutaceae bacterium]
MFRVRWLRCIHTLALAIFSGVTRCFDVLAADEPALVANNDVFEGQELTLKAEVEGGKGPFHYLWFKDLMPIPGAVEPELKFQPLRLTDSGVYWVTVFNDGGSTTSASEILTVRPGRQSWLANVSVVGPSSDRVIVAFTLGGNRTTGSTQILARAAGPALSQFGVAGALPDPVLSLFHQGRLLSSNDDWGGDVSLASAAAAVGAFPFSSSSKDSAVLLALPSSNYSAEVVDAGSGTGVTVVELYDTRSDPAELSKPRLISVAARGAIGEGAPLTAGFMILGDTPITVLLRGIGPSLERLGVIGAIADPKLSLFHRQTLISTNENWTDVGPEAIKGAQTAVGAVALDANSLDSAILVPLRPGLYSVQVSSAGEAGIAMIEVYEVP